MNKKIVTIIVTFLMAIIVVLYIGKELKVINIGTDASSEESKESKEYTIESVNKDYMFGKDVGKEVPTSLKDVPIYNIDEVVTVRGVEYSEFSVKPFNNFDSIPEEKKIGDYKSGYFLDVSFKMKNTNESSISACIRNYRIVCDYDDLDKTSSGEWVFRDNYCLLESELKLKRNESADIRLIVCFINENDWKECLVNSSNISFLIDPNGVVNYYKDAALIDIKDEVIKESK